MAQAKTLVPIKPDVLTWARLSAQMTRESASQELGVSVEEIVSWENKLHEFGITRLQKIANVYKRPVTALLRTTTPTLPFGPEDFRTVGGQEPRLGTDTLVAIRDTQRLVSIAQHLGEADPTFIPDLWLAKADLTEDSPEEVAAEERDRLDIDGDTQMLWKAPNEAYNRWRARIQSLGILTLAKPMPSEDCRGFSFYLEGFMPAIVVNSKESDSAKSFTLLHEYSHLMLRRHGLCLEIENVDKGAVERWCNGFAASVLVPADLLSEGVPDEEITLADVRRIARRFKVSSHVVALSLERIGRGDYELYAHLKSQDNLRDWRKPEYSPDDEPKIPQELRRGAELGYLFPKIVLEALNRGEIDTYTACRYLDIRANKLTSLATRTEATMAKYL